MKKIILSLMVLAAAVSANAQEAFRHLGVGFEAGTAAASVNVSVPVVTDHLVLKVGYGFPSINTTLKESLNISVVDLAIQNLNSELSEVGAPAEDQIATRFGNNLKMEFPVKVNLGSWKVMAEYYPFSILPFRLVAGAFIGPEEFISAAAYTDAAFWSNYNSVMKEFKALNEKYKDVPGYEPVNVPDIKANIGGETWAITEKDGCGYFDATVSIAKVRPYLGFGYGRSLPKHRVSFTMDIGAWYHGGPTITSTSKTTFDPNAENLDVGLDVLNVMRLYPVFSFGASVRLF